MTLSQVQRQDRDFNKIGGTRIARMCVRTHERTLGAHTHTHTSRAHAHARTLECCKRGELKRGFVAYELALPTCNLQKLMNSVAAPHFTVQGSEPRLVCNSTHHLDFGCSICSSSRTQRCACLLQDLLLPDGMGRQNLGTLQGRQAARSGLQLKWLRGVQRGRCAVGWEGVACMQRLDSEMPESRAVGR